MTLLGSHDRPKLAKFPHWGGNGEGKGAGGGGIGENDDPGLLTVGSFSRLGVFWPASVIFASPERGLDAKFQATK